MDNPRIAATLNAVLAISKSGTAKDVNRHISKSFRLLFQYEGFISLSRRDLPPGCYKITRCILNEEDELQAESADPWRDWQDLPTYCGGFLGEVTSGEYPEIIHSLYLKDDPVLKDDLSKMGSCMAIPLFDNGKPLNWGLFFRRDPRGFDVSDLERQILTANLIGGTTRNLVMAEQVRTLNQKLRHQLESVARIQTSLLPDHLPEIPRLTLGSSYLTADDAGGDYYDFFSLPDERWGILVADVSGHGVVAGTIMAMMSAAMRTSDPDILQDPAATFRYLNRHLVARRFEGQFITAFYAVFDPADCSLMFASAGHPSPRRRLPEGRVEELEVEHSIPLGILKSIDVHSATSIIKPEETIVIYTDGIVEAFDDNHEMFSVSRLDKAVRDCSGKPECVIDSVHNALFKHTGKMTRADDQTIVVLHRDSENNCEE